MKMKLRSEIESRSDRKNNFHQRGRPECSYAIGESDQIAIGGLKVGRALLSPIYSSK